MKEIKAGTTSGCVGCNTPNGYESWYRDDIQTGVDSNLDDICNSIYPAYEGNVSAGIVGGGDCDHY